MRKNLRLRTDQRIVAQPELLQLVEDAANFIIRLRDSSVVAAPHKLLRVLSHVQVRAYT